MVTCTSPQRVEAVDPVYVLVPEELEELELFEALGVGEALLGDVLVVAGSVTGAAAAAALPVPLLVLVR
jgi:hypothetical protein